tara:strand:+ start:15870 stop:16802 length:933 start_codon:yes stop_codon:yes gene_type:complete
MAWAQPKQTSTQAATTTVKYGAEYYRELFNKKRESFAPIRMALVGKENTAKTGTACDLALKHTDKRIIVLDCDNSAQNTVDYLVSSGVKNAENIQVIPLIDEMDEAMWNDDNTTNWVAVVEKLEWFTAQIGEDAEDIGAVIMDGGSTFLKWCEFVMTERLINRGVIKEEGDNFNQKEWRERNRVFKGVLNRLTALPVPYIFFTFHLKDKKQFMDIGNGTKAMMKVGEIVDWVDGTQRFVSQQIFLTRYTKKGDKAAGVEADKSLGENDFVIRAVINEMKGRNMEHLGKTYDLLSVKSGDVAWNGLPLRWD